MEITVNILKLFKYQTLPQINGATDFEVKIYNDDASTLITTIPMTEIATGLYGGGWTPTVVAPYTGFIVSVSNNIERAFHIDVVDAVLTQQDIRDAMALNTNVAIEENSLDARLERVEEETLQKD